MRICLAHEQGLEFAGELPAGVEVMVADRPAASDRVQFWVPPFLAHAPPSEELRALESLRVVQLLSAGIDRWLGRLLDQVTLCDARGVHSSATAEWAVTAILSYLRDFPAFARAQARQQWAPRATGELAGRRALIVGAGAIGAAIAARLVPFDVPVTLVARQARIDRYGQQVHGVDELPTLLPQTDIVVLIVPLTAATTGMVDASFLAAMPDGALLVNAARGRVVDTAALTAELTTGRIGAALDVTDPEPLPADHPLWGLPNLLLTPHVAASVGSTMIRAYTLVGDQIRRYAAGQPLINVVAGDY